MGSIIGKWTYAYGKSTIIRFDEKWGQHTFSRSELIELLDGKTIRFLYEKTNKYISGHIQYDEQYQRYIFVPTFATRQWVNSPKPPEEKQSEYKHIDKPLETMVAVYMEKHYYQPQISSGSIRGYKRITDKTRQKLGEDVLFIKNGKEYIVDEKAQVKYIYNPLDTFVLELLNSKSGKEGWLVDNTKTTNCYLFLWPYTKSTIIDVNSIERVEYALVERSAIINHIKAKTGYDAARLYGYAQFIKANNGKIDGAEEVKIKNESKGYKYKPDGFGSDMYIRYSSGIYERPINLVVGKAILELLSIEHGVL